MRSKLRLRILEVGLVVALYLGPWAPPGQAPRRSERRSPTPERPARIRAFGYPWRRRRDRDRPARRGDRLAPPGR